MNLKRIIQELFITLIIFMMIISIFVFFVAGINFMIKYSVIFFYISNIVVAIILFYIIWVFVRIFTSEDKEQEDEE